ncbi:polysaccharide biosynthesis/export family protein [Pseudomonas putida]|uniref:polysaccharide biosynthesis/export family protein n=1 Tax=Pseudomonas putida TaxID=303 RepID=UPI002168AF18|nr:polysaccharide biosynthesis/export family protein [Pseudomonas putida]
MVVLAVTLAGCSGTLSGAGPYKGAIERDNESYKLITIDASTIAPFMAHASPPSRATVTNPQIQAIKLLGGDVLDILITDNAPEGTGLFAPLSSGGTRFKARVDNQGLISLPYVGREFVAGMTLIQVEDRIKAKLRGITSDVQVHVEQVGDLSGSVLVAGAVKAPGRFSTLQGPLTLLDAINQAGGPELEPYLVDVTVRTGSNVRTYGYEEVLAGNNFALTPNSEVVLERARRRFVAMGAVGSPGLHDMPSKNTSLLDALGTVGGMKESSANPSGVFIFRLNGDTSAGKPQATVIHLDMRDPAAVFYAKQIALNPDDTLYVTNAAVYEAQKIISPIVQTLVLGRTVNGL